MKKITKLLLIAAIVAGLVGCGTDTAEENKVYTISTDAKFAPFSMEIDGVYEGIDVDILAAIAEVEGFEYELTPMDFSGIIPGLISGQLDAAIAGMTITEERSEQVDFSDGYFDSGLSLVTRVESTVTSVDQLEGLAAAVKKGTMGSFFAEDNAEQYGFTYEYYEDSPSMFLAVTNGIADFLCEDYPVISYSISTGTQTELRVAVDRLLGSPTYGFAVKKNKNPELLAMFNSGLAKIKENGT
jgi:polar amino acid transport system substrate-binding protein